MGQYPVRILNVGLTLALFVALQGCQKSRYYSVAQGAVAGPSSLVAKGGGDGTGFDGAISRYIHRDPSHSCQTLDTQGNPVPNDEIDVLKSAAGETARLVRANCAVLAEPRPIRPGDLQFATDGSGDLTYQDSLFAPMSAPTPVNMLASSQAFDNPLWQKQNILVGGNVTRAPDGTLSAELASQSAAADWHDLYQAVSYAPGSTVTFSVYVKAAGRPVVWLSFFSLPNYTDHLIGSFYLDQGTASVPSGTGTSTALGSTITPLANGWYRISLSGVISTTATSANATIYVVNSGDVGNAAGDGVSGVDLWGAQLELGSAASPYVPTN